MLPNPAVKLTNIGGTHLLASLASSAPLFAAYLFRWALRRVTHGAHGPVIRATIPIDLNAADLNE